jgi:hypothetical protein
MRVTKLERRIEELAEAGRTIYVGRQGWKSEWFAGCGKDGTGKGGGYEGYGSTAGQALDALIAELREVADKVESEAAIAANQARRLNAITKLPRPANGTTMALVQLGDIPLDGTWEVLCGNGIGWVPFDLCGNGIGWVPFDPRYHFAPQYMARFLVVARPIGSDDG